MKAKDIRFALTILFCVMLSLSIASNLFGFPATLAWLTPMHLCVYYVAAITVVNCLNERFPI